MEEETLKFFLWLVFIAVWIIAAAVKKKKDSAGVGAGERDTGPPEIAGEEEDYGDDFYEAPQDELSKFLRAISGVEESKPPVKKPPPETAGKPAPARPAPPRAVPPPGPSPGAFPEKTPLYRAGPGGIKSTAPSRGGMADIGDLDRKKLARGIVLSEILGPPRAKKPFIRSRFPRAGTAR